jgi:tetratricopeptide (TPR) repeat protein
MRARQNAMISLCLLVGAQAFLSPVVHATTSGDKYRTWEKYNKAGEEALAQNNFGEAEKLLLAGAKEAEKFGESDLRLATSSKNLADYYQVRGLPEKALPLYERWERVTEKSLGTASPQVIACVVKLTGLYVSQSKFDKGDPLARKLVMFADWKLSHYDPKASQAISQKDELLDLSNGLSSIARSYKGLGKYEQAEPLFKASLDIKEKFLTHNHLGIATSLGELGTAYMALNKRTEAEPLFLDALSITEVTMGKKSGQAIACANDLGRCYTSEGKYTDAESVFKEIMETMKSSGRQNPAVILSYAWLERSEGKFMQAEQHMKEALTITERLNGSQSYSLAPILDDYADLLQKMHRDADASRILARARTIRGM